MKPLAGIAQARQRQLLRPEQSAMSSPRFRWRLTRRLVSGGRLALFRAAAAGDLGPGCYVVKTPRTNADAVAAAMLRHEVVVTESVQHPNLAAVLTAVCDGPKIHTVLPYLEGVTLRQLMTGRLLDVSHALAIVRQVAAALAALHAGGWLHSLMRPEHVIVSPQSQATLINLTQTRRLESSECDVQAGMPGMAGRKVCLTYAAPEMFASHARLTAAADTYGLGILLFEVLVGEPPFPLASARELARAHQSAAPPDVRSFRAELTTEIAELVRRMLVKEPLRRPSDEELLRWLTELEIEELSN